MNQISDYGGCGCDMCAPYPKTYLKVLEEQSALINVTIRRQKIVASGIPAPVADNDMLRGLLEQKRVVDYVGSFPRGVKAGDQGDMLGETTMTNGWGHLALPHSRDIKRGYEIDLVHLSGAQYSEAFTNDVNRFALLQFARSAAFGEDVAQLMPGIGSAQRTRCVACWSGNCKSGD